jgi:predicted transcriptional regulator
MAGKTQLIEVDEETAALLRARAAARGLSVPELLAEILTDDVARGDAGTEAVAELDRRWGRFEEAGAPASHDEVVRWLETWGRPSFKPWPTR